MLNKQTVCGILRPLEWQKYLQASEQLSALLQPSHIRSPFDSRDEKETVSSASTPAPPRCSAFSFPFFLFLRCPFFFSQRQALKMGKDTPLVVSMAWIMLALLPDRVVYWCVWHSKWEIFSNLARLRAKSSFSFLTGNRTLEHLKECHFLSPTQPLSLWSLSLRPPCFELANIAYGCRNKTQCKMGSGASEQPPSS